MTDQKELREKIEEILKEHEVHLPVYTCRLQMSHSILSLISQRDKELVGKLEKLIPKPVPFKYIKQITGSASFRNGYDLACQLMKENVDEVIKLVEER